ncbi:atp-dependent hsl protease atp-binding subunit hslu, partial [Cystoisospora suis]
MKNQRSRLQDVMRPTAVHRAEQKILEALLGNLSAEEHQQWLRHLRCGDLDSRKVHVDIPLSTKTGGGGGAGYRESPSSSSSSSSGGGSSGYGTDPNAIVLDIESILRDMDQQASSHRHTSPFFSSSPRGRGGFDRFSSFHHHEGGGRGQRGSHHSYLTVKEARLKLMQAELDAMITK